MVFLSKDTISSFDRPFVASERGRLKGISNSSNWFLSVGYYDCFSYEKNTKGIVVSSTVSSNWVEQKVATYANLEKVEILSDNTAICIGNNSGRGIILETESGGASLTLTLDKIRKLKCHQIDTLKPIVEYDGTNNLTYTWFPENGLSGPTVLMPVVIATEDIEYILTVSDGILELTDTLSIKIDKLPDPDICLVTIDESTVKNKLVVQQQSLLKL